MRFLHSKTLEFREFPNHEVVVYAILSHTWGPDEVLFHELDGLNAKNTPKAIKQKSGYQKIQACCAKAASDGFEYAWVDTCCIDKRSSAELSEAINSMYRWYQDCAVCYAYLADVPNDLDGTTQRQKFEHSRWFTRGWTLQELIAPSVLEFYGDQWISRGQGASLGTQRSLSDVISKITRIPSPVLLRYARLSSYSSAQKMTWAAGRETTREEDRAYSLMGLFNVNMPLLYGEGKQAFSRLQEELMKISADETLFAWKIDPNRSDLPYPAGAGLLALSPDDFFHSASIDSASIDWHEPVIGSMQRTTPFSVTNMGIQLEVMLLKACDSRGLFCIDGTPFEYAYNDDSKYIIVLNCYSMNSTNLIGITGGFPGGYEKSRPNNQFLRYLNSPNGGLVLLDSKIYQPSDRDRTTIFAAARNLGSSDRLLARIYGIPTPQWLYRGPQGFRLVETWPKDLLLGHASSFLACDIALLFDNGEDAFAVRTGFDYEERSTRINISLRSPGKSLRQEYEEDPTTAYLVWLAGSKSDRVSYKLNSGRMVYVSLRPQQVHNSVVYGLHIAVDGEQLFNSPAAGFVQI